MAQFFKKLINFQLKLIVFPLRGGKAIKYVDKVLGDCRGHSDNESAKLTFLSKRTFYLG